VIRGRAGALLVLIAALAGCSQIAGAVLGSGPKVAANVQAGRTNAQTLGAATFSDQRIVRPNARTIEQSSGATQLRTERVDQVVIQDQDTPPWIWFLALAGWMLPTPQALARWVWARRPGGR